MRDAPPPDASPLEPAVLDSAVRDPAVLDTGVSVAAGRRRQSWRPVDPDVVPRVGFGAVAVGDQDARDEATAIDEVRDSALDRRTDPGFSSSADLAVERPDDLERIAPVRTRWRVGVGAAIVLVIVALCCAVLVSMFSGRGRTDVVPLPVATASGEARTSAGGSATETLGAGGYGSSAPSTLAASPPPTSVPSPPILLHVLGAVLRPGLYELHSGDRVIDAVSAAGGFSPTADQTQQNLARVVADGEQLVIPEQGVSPPLGSVAAGPGGSVGVGRGGGGAGGSPASGGAPGTQPPLVNINTADQTALETLPQVGPALAQRIIAWRSTNGGFAQLDDLKNVTGIGDKTFDALKPLVTI